MEIAYLLTAAERDALVAKLRCYDLDFEPDFPPLPLLVCYVRGESNGYPYIWYATWDAPGLRYALQRLAEGGCDA